MSVINIPTIKCSGQLTKLFYEHQGKSCIVDLKIKYYLEDDEFYVRIWMVPGWNSCDIWQKAYKYLRSKKTNIDHDLSEIEDASFESLKLV